MKKSCVGKVLSSLKENFYLVALKWKERWKWNEICKQQSVLLRKFIKNYRVKFVWLSMMLDTQILWIMYTLIKNSVALNHVEHDNVYIWLPIDTVSNKCVKWNIMIRMYNYPLSKH